MVIRMTTSCYVWHAQNMTRLTKLLNGPVCTPRQFQCHVNPPPLVLHSLVCLEGDSRAGSLRDNGHQLEMKEIYSIGILMLKKIIDCMVIQKCFVCGRCLFLPFPHSWIDLSPLSWCGQWLNLAQPATHIGHFHQDGAPRVPYGRSSAQEVHHTGN